MHRLLHFLINPLMHAFPFGCRAVLTAPSNNKLLFNRTTRFFLLFQANTKRKLNFHLPEEIPRSLIAWLIYICSLSSIKASVARNYLSVANTSIQLSIFSFRHVNNLAVAVPISALVTLHYTLCF